MIQRLQAIAPHRLLSRTEALAIAEIQAARLRDQLGVHDAAVTDSQIKALPDVRIEFVENLGVSGATRRIGNLWVILVNQNEATVRQRFTIAHEFKHILDDAATTHLHRQGQQDRRPWLTERLCDYFAACFLMPRLWVKRLWGRGEQDPAALARRFQVSVDAMEIRLQQLGLVDRTSRCAAPPLNPVALPARTAA